MLLFWLCWHLTTQFTSYISADTIASIGYRAMKSIKLVVHDMYISKLFSIQYIYEYRLAQLLKIYIKLGQPYCPTVEKHTMRSV